MSERTFEMGNGISIRCQYEKTRMAFRHVAVVFKNNSEVYRTKIAYQNRTWEAYEYQSVLIKAIEGSNVFSNDEKLKALEYAKKDHTDWAKFNSVVGIAYLGDILFNEKKEKNDWKKRMLKAGLEGINFPNDWDELSEDEKENRLKMALSVIEKKKVE